MPKTTFFVPSGQRARLELHTWEEVLCLKEEMRWVLKSLEWKAQWWIDHLKVIRNIGTYIQEGLVSYMH